MKRDTSTSYPRCSRRRERGAVLAEFALILPFLVILFVIIVDLGLVVREHQLLQNGAREGAHFSALPANWIDPSNPTATVASIKDRVIDYLAEEKISISAGAITVNQKYPILIGGTTAYGSKVTVTYTRQPLIGFPVGGLTLSANAVFRNLY